MKFFKYLSLKNIPSYFVKLKKNFGIQMRFLRYQFFNFIKKIISKNQ